MDGRYYFSQQGSETTQENKSLNIIPSFTLRKENLTITAGLHINSFQNKSQINAVLDLSYLFPYLEVKAWFGEGWSLQGSLDGGYVPNSQKNFIQRNPYLNQRIDLNPTHQALNAEVSLAKFSKIFSIRAFAKVILEENKPFFVNSISEPAAFEISYLFDNLFTTLELGTSGSYEWEKLRLKGAVHYWIYQWNTGRLDVAHHLPKIKINLTSEFQPMKNLFVQLELNYLGGLQTIDGNTSQTIIDLNPISEVNLKANYSLNTNFDFFVDVNNLLSQNYQRYLFYRLRTLNGRVGVRFKL